MLITFSGMDCSGKSTQIELLRGNLAARGRSVATLWFRPGYSAEANALKRLARRMLPRALPGAADPSERERIFSKPGVTGGWVRMALADTVLQYGIKTRVLLMSGKTVIADRYFDDGALDLALRFERFEVSSWPSFRAARALCAEPTHAFLLAIPYDEMLARMQRKNEPFSDPPQIRDRRFAAYEMLAGSGKYRVIEANRPPERIHEEVVSALEL